MNKVIFRMETNIKVFSAAELWQNHFSLPSIPTFSQSLDKVLGNDGIKLGSITEVIGLPGSGKTQLCLQLCASVQIPKALGGLDSEALYIDTNTNFHIVRFREILLASLSKCYSITGSSSPIDEEQALNRLYYVKAIGLEKFCALIHKIDKIVEDESKKIRLIVIDSIAFPFKEGISATQRTGLLFRMMADLHRLADSKQIAVVLTNEMSTRVGLSSGSVVGALGDAWAHRCNTRLLLSHSSGERKAALVKSNDVACSACAFQITSEGIRDVN